MNIEVRYYSKSGNTKKIADVIANQAGVKAEAIDKEVNGEVDILFLGTGLYAFDIDAELKEYISKLDPKNIKKVVVFSTAAIVKSAYEKTKKCLENQGLMVADQEYHCQGHYMLFSKGHPNSEDLEQAKNFAKTVIDNN